MKIIIKNIVLVFLFFFVFLSQVQAQNAYDYIDKIRIRLDGGDNSGRTVVPKNFSDSVTIYTEQDESYLKSSLDSVDYVPIGIHNSSVRLVTSVYFDKNKLLSIAGWNNYKTIVVKKHCQGTVLGDQTVTVSISEFVNDDYTVEFPADPNCMIDLFYQQNFLEIEFELKNGTTKKYAKSSYIFDLQPKPLANTCQLEVQNTNREKLVFANNNTSLIVVGTGIDDGGQGYSLTLNGEVKTSFTEIIGDFGSMGLSDGPPEFTYNLGPLEVKDYTLAVKQYDSNIILCSMSLPIYQDGTQPTPFSQVTRPPDQDGYISSSVVDIAVTIPLCDSITDPDLKSKCQACEGSGTVIGGVWTGLGCLPTNFSGIVGSIFTLFSGLMGGLVFLCLVSNGIKIMSSRGNPEALKKGQEAITACLVGFVVLALSILFLKIVGVDILQIPGWS